MALEERDIKKLVDAMSTPQIAALVQTMAQLERTKKESGQFYGFVANAKQVPIINCTKRIMTVRGGNRCLGAETEIYDPVAGVSKPVSEIDGDFHVYAWDGEKRVIAKALKPFKKDRLRLLKVTFENGQSIVVSEGHLILTGWGWCPTGRMVQSRHLVGAADLQSGLDDEAGDPPFTMVPELYFFNPNGPSDIDIKILESAKRRKSYNHIVDCTPMRSDFVWDFEVPGYGNYFIGDILNHNSSKTHGVAYLDALHATGLYPDEIKYIDKRNGPVLTEPYTGLKFNRAPKMGIISVSMSQMIRGIQAKLFGPPHDFGTGLIPKDLILDHREVSKSNGCVDWAIIKHSSGGTTEMNFMYYTQEVENFQGFDWDWAHFDEQPPYPYFEEVQMRMLDRGGYIAMTYWPREERSELEEKLLVYMEKSPDYYADFMLEWWDNHYLDEDTVKMMEAVMTTEEKESRQYGRPRGVEGRIFPYIKDDFVCEPFEIEPHWRRIASLDVGFGHPTGALIAAIDDNSRTVYIYNEYLNDKELPAVHASALRGWGDVDFYTDNQSKKVSPTDGNNLFDMYKNEGLHIISAENYAGSVQTSINMVNQLFAEHRLYIFSTCRELIRQVLLYRRVKSKNGEIHIVKRDDDLVDPLRYIGLHLEKARVMGYHEVKPQPKIVEWAPVNSNIGF